ncbi:MAG: pilus assembly protein TadG-related protein [Candidatus Sulfotelmatobacter sp.]
MKPAVIRPGFVRRTRLLNKQERNERGVTMIIVALAMVAIIAMAALSIDVITLYLAREEAQRSADSAALAAAKIISVSGLTGDPSNGTANWGKICGPDDGTNGLATRTAKAVAGQDAVGGLAATTINVTYSVGSGAGTGDCTTLAGTGFGINPIVSVQLSRASLPSFFSRIWGNTGNSVSARASAETYNPSNSGGVSGGIIIPVQPRCVKPWVVPNLNPRNPDGCTTACTPFVNLSDGSIQNSGISLNGFGTTGVIGENFWLDSDCHGNPPGSCLPRANPPQGNYTGGTAPAPPNLLYLPGQVGPGTPLAIPSSCNGDDYQNAIVGCDQPANYYCGFPPATNPNPTANAVDLAINPRVGTSNGSQCLIHQSNPTDVGASSGQDSLNPFGAPSSYPFQILAGSNNPTGLNNTPVSISSSIVSIPIYDQTTAPPFTQNIRSEVTFVGFLQVFINAADQLGNVNVTVLNVAGCSNGSGLPVSTTTQVGNSPVPVRLITPP